MTLNEYISSVKDKRICVIGIGVSNTPLIKRLLSDGCNVTACDKRTAEELGDDYAALSALGAKFMLGEGYLDKLDFDLIFRTPGLMPFDEHLEAAGKRGAQLTSEMELFMSLCPCKIFAVTGSDGKTTTTTIISELLKAQGYTVHLGGNIGTPLLCDVDGMKPDDMVVLELSSFQLHSMKCRPDVAVITNVSPNHLDKHKDYQDYIDAKNAVFAMQDKSDRLVLNHENEFSEYYAGKALSHISYFSRVSKPQNGVFCTDGVIYRVHDGEESEIMRADEIKLPGVHNLENYMAAFAATDDYVSNEVCVQTAKTFNGVEHRLEQVRVLNGVTFINDSIGTSPTRTAAGLHAVKTKPILIAGGEAINADFVLEFIKSRGITKLDYYVVSHPHSDHMGAASRIIDSIPIDKFVTTDFSELNMPTSKVFENMLDSLERQTTCEVVTVRAGDVLNAGKLKLNVIRIFVPPHSINSQSPCPTSINDTRIVPSDDTSKGLSFCPK